MHAKVKLNLTFQLNLDLIIACNDGNQRNLKFYEGEKDKLDSLEPLGNGVSLVE